MSTEKVDIENVTFVFDWTESLKAEIVSVKFDLDDIRKDFFKLLYDVSYNYYIGLIAYDISKYINSGQIVFQESVMPYKVHIDRLMEISQLRPLEISHFNAANRSLHIECWSVFELCTTTLCEALCSEDELKKLLSYNITEIKKLHKSEEISDKGFELLCSKLKAHHLTHVPMPRKIDFLFSKAVNYYRNVKNDKEFLIFFAKLRNTIHTNFIYYGKDYEYKFGDAHFIFNNGKLVKWRDPFEPSPKLYFYLVGQLKEIWKTLVLSIKHDNLVSYPDLDQQ